MASTSTAPSPWPAPESGASLLLAFTPPTLAGASTSTSTLAARRTVVILGSGRLASIRAFACLEAGHKVAVLPCSLDGKIHDPELAYRILSGQIVLLDAPAYYSQEDSEQAWSDYIEESIPADVLDDTLLVCITDTIATSSLATSTHTLPRSPSSALAIRQAFFKLRIPVNVADYPSLSDFHFPATHRFPLLVNNETAIHDPSGQASTESASPLQIAITTNGNSCRLASRIRREIVSKLPKGVGSAVARIGKLRQQARQIDQEEQQEQPSKQSKTTTSWSLDRDIEQGEREEGWSPSLLNKPVPQILAPRSSIQAVGASTSKCTSPNRQKLKQAPALHALTSRPMHPSQMPLTPPATPPLRALANADNIDFILGAGDVARDIIPPSLTRMRFIAQICKRRNAELAIDTANQA